MIICFTFGGKRHYFNIPIIEFPIVIPIPDPNPINFPAFLSDAIIVASLQALAEKIADTNVRQAVERGHSSAIEALQKHIGPEVTIRTE
jgi:hypothetical protein